ncbi:type VI secretion system protein ImpG [Chitinivorax tropicus]|uniref:Type VI secretion system protein ImpG n=1 Tax=Chitinivorax tropicus TaxID=714531 RepID=A0A840MS08_9PROT|nr:type VI secretion system baseplate subunit TssF [Chitinivorax tropicus]MBB5019917.1 type VI secretion system protein ImpG [Chitinivorax tropicus]
MDDLLPYYESELTLLKRHAREFAEQYPKIANRLLMAGETVEDPHVERLIQAFALLAARVHKKLEDDYPEFTAALFEVLYPQYLRPFPACSIARFGAATAGQVTATVCMLRGTMLNSRPIKGVPVKFRTAYDVHLSPISLNHVAFKPYLSPPAGTSLPPRSNASLTFTLTGDSDQAGLESLDLDRLRVFIDAEPSLVSLLREVIFQLSVGAAIEVGLGPWKMLPGKVCQPVGFSADEALLGDDARSHAAYRLLIEYLTFPEKFNFFDIDLAALRRWIPPRTRSLKLHLLLDTASQPDTFERLMEQVNASHFQLFCTPVVNLFELRGEPIRVDHRKVQYPVVPDARRASAFEVYAIDSVDQVRESAAGVEIHPFQPFYSLKHSRSQSKGRYWHLSRDERVANRSPGHEYEIMVVDEYFDPSVEQEETLSIQLRCTNRDLPSQMPVGLAEGDLFMEGGSSTRTIQLLRKPTATYRFSHTGDGSWRLISALSLNHLSLVEQGGDALREILALYNLPGNSQNRRLIEGIEQVSTRGVTTRMAGNPFPTFVKGVEVRISVSPGNFVGTGVWLFAQIMSRFLGLYVHLNNFVQVVVVNAATGEVLHTCEPCSGDITLL